MSYKYYTSVQGENIKRSNSWSNVIKYAKELAKDNTDSVVSVKSVNGYISESFIWCSELQDIIPA
jgi:hypothetical protein